MKYQFLFNLILIAAAVACSEEHTPRETLPPATQTGANTFGCLLNGKVWLPKGNNGTSNMSPTYDPNFNGSAVFGISSYRILPNNDRKFLGIGIIGISKTGTYAVSDTLALAGFSGSCEYLYYDAAVYRKGSIVVTRFDLPIVSGTFNFILYKSNCDTVKVTQGRFDIKL